MRRDYPDKNAKELLDALAKEGWISRGIAKRNENDKGTPDAIVSRRGSRRNHMLEIKSLGGALRETQKKFIMEWPGCIHVATNSFEANLLLRECEDRQ